MWLWTVIMMIPSVLVIWAFTSFVRTGDQVGLLGTAILTPLFIWVAGLAILERIFLTEDSIRFDYHHLLPTREFQWSEIRRIKIGTTAPVGAESIEFRVYEVEGAPPPYAGFRRFLIGPKGALIGPWIKNYKQLLRDILAHVSPDCKIDPEVIHVSRFLDSTEGRMRLAELREQGLAKPPSTPETRRENRRENRRRYW